MKSKSICLLIAAVIAACLLLLQNSFASDGQYAKTVEEWNRPVDPFRIIGNIFYVGASDVTSFLITTPDGHIVIDGGFIDTAPMIAANIQKLGFKLKDVKILLNSHAHFDHAGGIAELKELTAARFLASREDAALIAAGGHGDFHFHDTLTFRPAQADQIIQDGEAVRLGGVTLIAHLTPGHTKGCTTWTMQVKDGGALPLSERSTAPKIFDVVFIGSTTINPGVKLLNEPNYKNIAADYARTFGVLKSLHCDVFLGPHANFFGMDSKRERLKQGALPNPFIDPGAYTAFIKKTEDAYLHQLEEERRAVVGGQWSGGQWAVIRGRASVVGGR
jgi:metallo-beta-lactamase class B